MSSRWTDEDDGGRSQWAHRLLHGDPPLTGSINVDEVGDKPQTRGGSSDTGDSVSYARFSSVRDVTMKKVPYTPMLFIGHLRKRFGRDAFHGLLFVVRRGLPG